MLACFRPLIKKVDLAQPIEQANILCSTNYYGFFLIDLPSTKFLLKELITFQVL